MEKTPVLLTILLLSVVLGQDTTNDNSASRSSRGLYDFYSVFIEPRLVELEDTAEKVSTSRRRPETGPSSLEIPVIPYINRGKTHPSEDEEDRSYPHDAFSQGIQVKHPFFISTQPPSPLSIADTTSTLIVAGTRQTASQLLVRKEEQ